MNNATTILLNEKKRLESLRDSIGDEYSKFAAPFMVEETAVKEDGSQMLVSYIDCDRLNVKERSTLDTLDSSYREAMARISVLENYIKSQVPSLVFKTYNQHVDPISDFQNITIRCNNIGVDENGKFTQYSVKVGKTIVSSPAEMTVVEYAKLYTSILTNELYKALGTGISPEEFGKKVSEACTEVYLGKQKDLTEETSKEKKI